MPAWAGKRLTVRARVGEPHLQILAPSDAVLATHRRAPAGAGQLVRSSEHAAALERAVLDAFTIQPSCRRKVNRPPSDRALAALAARHDIEPTAPVVSLERYAALAEAC